MLRAKRKKTEKKNEQSFRNLLSNVNQSNICVIGVPKGEQTTNGVEKNFEEMVNIPNLMKDIQLLMESCRLNCNSSLPKKKKIYIGLPW